MAPRRCWVGDDTAACGAADSQACDAAPLRGGIEGPGLPPPRLSSLAQNSAAELSLMLGPGLDRDEDAASDRDSRSWSPSVTSLLGAAGNLSDLDDFPSKASSADEEPAQPLQETLPQNPHVTDAVSNLEKFRRRLAELSCCTLLLLNEIEIIRCRQVSAYWGLKKTGSWVHRLNIIERTPRAGTRRQGRRASRAPAARCRSRTRAYRRVAKLGDQPQPAQRQRAQRPQQRPGVDRRLREECSRAR